MSSGKSVETIREDARGVIRSDRMMGLVVSNVIVNDDNTLIEFNDGNSISLKSKTHVTVQRDYLDVPLSLSRKDAAGLFKVLEDAGHPFASLIYSLSAKIGWDLGVDLGVRRDERA